MRTNNNHVTTTLLAAYCTCLLSSFRNIQRGESWRGNYSPLIKAGCDMAHVSIITTTLWATSRPVASAVATVVPTHSPTRQKWLWYETTTRHNHFDEWATAWLRVRALAESNWSPQTDHIKVAVIWRQEDISRPLWQARPEKSDKVSS